RLENAVAFADAPSCFIKARTIQRVRHGAYHLPRDITRQMGIGIQGDDVSYANKLRDIADNARKMFASLIILPVAQQPCIQVSKLAALTFISHPDTRLRIPASRSMKQKKWFVFRYTMFCVQRF